MRIPVAPRHDKGFYEARPGDVAGRDDLPLIDVRDERELTDRYGFGHIHGVGHRPMERILAEGLPGHPKDAPVVLVCDNGFRSRRCAARLAEAGFAEVYHLVGGMKRWTAEGRPVARVPTWRPAPGEPPVRRRAEGGGSS
ncbi:MAG: rhodanese-like domain-containing protein [Myxococcota bacterium]